ncbi:MAG: hypothetical protein IKZ13_04235 [Akkermansia sp.]|nr:hypothetical protein [Akkermansia sp.]
MNSLVECFKDRIRKIVCYIALVAIIVIPWCNICTGVEFADTFLALNEFTFFDSAPRSVCTPVILTAYLGHLMVDIADYFQISPLLWLRCAVVILFWAICLCAYWGFEGKIGRTTMLVGFAVGAVLSKITLYTFYYTLVSQMALCFVTILLLKSLEKENRLLLGISAFFAVLSVFLRISNAVYLFIFILLLVRKNAFSKSQWKFYFSGVVGALLASIVLILFFHICVGWERILELPEVIKYTTTDGHTPLLLLRYALTGFITKDFLFFCIILLFLLIVLRTSYQFSSVILRNVWQCFVLFSLAAGLMAYMSLGSYFIPGKTDGALYWGFVISCVLQCMNWLNVLLLSLFCYLKRPLDEIRYLLAALLVAVLGPVGSNTVPMPELYSSFFILPILFQSLKQGVFSDLFSDVVKDIKWKKSLRITIVFAILLSFVHSCIIAFSYSFGGKIIPLVCILDKSKVCFRTSVTSLLEPFNLFPNQKEHYEACILECSPYIIKGKPLISMNSTAEHSLLSAPPALKWRGGQIYYTTPAQSIREQLLKAEELPAILTYIPGLKLPEDKAKVIRDIVELKNYKVIRTPHYEICLPPGYDKNQYFNNSREVEGAQRFDR